METFIGSRKKASWLCIIFGGAINNLGIYNYHYDIKPSNQIDLPSLRSGKTHQIHLVWEHFRRDCLV